MSGGTEAGVRPLGVLALSGDVARCPVGALVDVDTLAVAEGVAWLADADRLVILNSAGTFAAHDSATGVCINISN